MRLYLLLVTLAGCGRIGFGDVLAIDEARGLLSVGDGHACAIRDGAAWCWGDGLGGALGDHLIHVSSRPVRVDLADPVQISAGHDFTCAVTATGTVSCWGSNGEGQLGATHSGFASPTEYPDPEQVVLPQPAREVATGSSHACALLTDSTVWCWGANGAGQLGRAPGASAPAVVPDLDDVAQLALGGSSSCALHHDGAVSCWGQNDHGQLGLATMTDTAVPTKIDDFTATALALANQHACARLGTGALACWGDNSYGQFGDGTHVPQLRPTTHSGASEFATVAVGNSHDTCGVRDDGVVLCWGFNASGTVGDGSHSDRDAPVAVLDSAVTVATGGLATCALRESGEVMCWGYGDFGILGNGVSAAASAMPTGQNATRLGVGSSHTCSATNNELRCWGRNEEGQLGNGTTTLATSPTLAQNQWSATGPGTIDKIVAGTSHTCILRTGDVWCWGDNYYGQLGDGTTDRSSIALLVPLPAPATSLSSGSQTVCALLVDKTVACWGANSAGMVGDGTQVDAHGPQLVQTTSGLLTGVDELGMGWAHACVRVGGQVLCWGANDTGQLGLGTTESLQLVATPNSITTATSLDVGGRNACANDGAGVKKCWGVRGGNGENLPQGGTMGWEVAPVDSSIVGPLVFGYDLGCAPAMGTCWGNSYHGKLGIGTLAWGIPSGPTPIMGLPFPPVELANGDEHTCAISNGDVYCWGDDSEGQLGIGVASRSLVPIAVQF